MIKRISMCLLTVTLLLSCVLPCNFSVNADDIIHSTPGSNMELRYQLRNNDDATTDIRFVLIATEEDVIDAESASVYATIRNEFDTESVDVDCAYRCIMVNDRILKAGEGMCFLIAKFSGIPDDTVDRVIGHFSLDSNTADVSVRQPEIDRSYVIYVDSKNGSDENDGSMDNPIENLSTAIELMNTKEKGGKIVLLDDVYSENYFSSDTKAILRPVEVDFNGHKLVAMNSPESYKVQPYLVGLDDIYVISSQDYVKHIVYKNENGEYQPFELVKTQDECLSTEYTYCYSDDSDDIIVHMPKDVPLTLGDNSLLCIENNQDGLICSSENGFLSLKNATILGKNMAVRITGKASCVADNCKFLFANSNGFSAQGDGTTKSVLLTDCEAAYNFNDGFNYHNQGTAVEINCVGHDNGYMNKSQSQNTNNGSTAHESFEVTRISCSYYNNQGGNVVDINSSSSRNFGCVAYNSTADVDIFNSNFAIQSDGNTRMYLYGCKAFGSVYDLSNSSPNATLAIKSTAYTTNRGNISIIE